MTSALCRGIFDVSAFSVVALGVDILEVAMHWHAFILDIKGIQLCHWPALWTFWGTCACVIYLAISIAFTGWFLKRYSEENQEWSISIGATRVKPFAMEGSWQLLAAISPWISILWHATITWLLWACMCITIMVFLFTRIHHHYNILCRLWGFKQYEVEDGNNTYLMFSRSTIKNVNQIHRFNEIDEYTGILL